MLNELACTNAVVSSSGNIKDDEYDEELASTLANKLNEEDEMTRLRTQ